MTISVIGVGVGRTGTYSLRTALNQLGCGPCHHMEEVLHNQPVQVPLWTAAVNGDADWKAIFKTYNSAVDWPTAGFYRELLDACPEAKFILTVRSAESWAASFSETIYTLLAKKNEMPKQMQPWFEMAVGVTEKSGFPAGLDCEGLMAAFVAHNDAVKATIPADQLLVFEVKEGWSPLCAFLDVPVPAEPFPRTNGRSEFWDRVGGKG